MYVCHQRISGQEAFHVPLVGKFLDKTIKYNGNAINQITYDDNNKQ